MEKEKKYKKATQKQLAEYLGVTPGAVSQYDKKKLELMLLGLFVKNNTVG